MPNEQDLYVPRNTWVHMGEGNCERCDKPRDLYTNSWVPNVINCARCLLNLFNAIVIFFTDAMATIEGTEAAVLAEPNYFAIRAEYADVRDRCDSFHKPAYQEGRCRTCHNPIIDGTEGSYMGTVTYDGQMKEHRSHYNCSLSCDDCDQYFVGWNVLSCNDVTLMSFEKYLGTKRCEPCSLKLVADYGGLDNFFWCEQCDSYELRDESYTYNDVRYCESCYDNCVSHCEDCDDHYLSDDGHNCDGESILLHEYDYRPRPHFFGDGTYHFGFELEVECRSDSRKEGAEYVIDRLGNRAYLKKDGSLNNGFEIVTHPHTLEEYQKEFNWGCVAGLGDLGYRSWSTRTCGLHVHVSRTAFGIIQKQADVLKVQAHELRFIKLIYDNQRQIERLAGRSSSYARFNDKGKLSARVKHGRQDDRYEAVNSQNSETLEVRVFKGSLKPTRILSAIELVHASVEYTRDLKVSGSNNALKWIHFVRYVASNADAYPNLVSNIQSTFDTDTEPSDNDSDN